eukprot:TRINITY_DN4571_c1_g1_i1.p1 TRINITY_DN4571_c1_g1~~TRINITY_DN4571_c1_g1_i1.p1  ORF type:complete len:502 (+),score=121.27 TRINITY_DN4571_c1_g1_i1:83-1507(+)
MDWVRRQIQKHAPRGADTPRAGRNRRSSDTGSSADGGSRQGSSGPRPPPPLVGPRGGGYGGAAASTAAHPAEGVVSPASAGSPKRWLQRRQRYADSLEPAAGQIDLAELRKLARAGIPDELRGTYWKLLLGYLPVTRENWAEHVRKRREQYRSFRSEFIVVPASIRRKQGGDGPEVQDRRGDHPLSSGCDSEWKKYRDNRPIFDKVDVDVPRTMPSLHFFHTPEAAAAGLRADCPAHRGGSVTDIACVEPSRGTKFCEQQQRLRRILFLYALLNPGLSYVQGMNEVAAVLFYTFATCPSPDWDTSADADDVEADAFFCLSELLGLLGDAFCRALDTDAVGIRGYIAHFSAVLRLCDEELWMHLEGQSLKPDFYSLRWLTLLVSQEFPVPDVLRVWDFLFGEKQGVYCALFFVAAAMVLGLREQLAENDFAANLEMLQNYPPCDVNALLVDGPRCARALLAKHPGAASLLKQRQQ